MAYFLRISISLFFYVLSLTACQGQFSDSGVEEANSPEVLEPPLSPATEVSEEVEVEKVEEELIPADAGAVISTFEIFGAVSIIDVPSKSVFLSMPFGTDLSNLSPRIVHTGKSIVPGDGVSTDFSEPVTYTLESEDGTQYSFTVTASWSEPDFSLTPDLQWYPAIISAMEGDGSAGTPYQITNLYELQMIASLLTSDFIIANNIDASPTATWNSGAGFTYIGDNSSADDTTRFTGTLDGNNLSVTGLVMNRPADWNVGMFFYNSGVIRNLNVVEATIIGDGGVAILVVMNEGLVSHAHTSGQVTAYNGDAGGLADYNSGGIIEFSSSAANVSGKDWVGGLVGLGFGWSNPVSIIRDSYATGIVTGNNYIGGLVGGVWSGNASITRSYSTGDVSGVSDVGGFVGTLSTYSYGVANCYATGNVSGTTNVGGFVGNMYRSGSTYSYSTGIPTGTTGVGGFIGAANGGSCVLTGTYWDKDTSGTTVDGGSGIPVGSSSTAMKLQATYVGFDFTTIWTIDEGNARPVFQ